MIAWSQFLVVLVPVVAGGCASAVQNWFKEDDVLRSALHGILGSIVTAVVSAVGLAIFGGHK
jgi:hypothetical protein